MENTDLTTRNSNDMDARRAELGMEKARLSAQSAGLKLLMWLIIITVCGIIACAVLAVLKIAVQSIVVVAAVLLAIGLMAVVGYNAVKVKIKEHRVEKDE